MRWAIGAIVIFAILLGGCITPPPPTTQNTLWITPATTIAYVNQTCIVTVQFNTSYAVKGWEFEVHYDEDILGVQDVTFLDGNILRSPIIVRDGSIPLYAVLGESSYGEQLVQITFIVRAKGTGHITLAGVSLCNESAIMPVEIKNATVFVN